MFYGWYIVSACALITMYLSGTVTMGFTTIFDPVASEMGWSYTQISFAASLRGFEVGLLVPISGMIMDRWGPRRLVFGGLIITSAGMLMLSQVHSLSMFYAAFGLVCVGMSTSPATLLMSAVANWFRRNEGLAMGVTASGVSLGGLLIPVMTYFVDAHGWRQTMVIAGLGVWAFLLPLSLLLRHKPELYGALPDGEADVNLERKNPSIHVSKRILNVGAKEALVQPVFWIMASAFVCHVMAVTAITTHIMPFFSSIGIDCQCGSPDRHLRPRRIRMAGGSNRQDQGGYPGPGTQRVGGFYFHVRHRGSPFVNYSFRPGFRYRLGRHRSDAVGSGNPVFWQASHGDYHRMCRQRHDVGHPGRCPSGRLDI
jgi:MFS family permease